MVWLISRVIKKGHRAHRIMSEKIVDENDKSIVYNDETRALVISTE